MTENQKKKKGEGGIKGDDNDNNPKSYPKYVSLASQMAISFLLAVFAGRWLDKKFQFEFPVFTIILSLVTIIATLRKIISDNPPSK